MAARAGSFICRAVFVTITLACPVFLFGIEPGRAEEKEELRANLRRFAADIAEDKDKMKKYRYCAMKGNLQTYWYSWGCANALRDAHNRAARECEKRGTGCQDMYNLNIHNYTENSVTVYLFGPDERTFDESLFNWTLAPYDKGTLTIGGNRIYVPKTYFLLVRSDETNGRWGPHNIGGFNYTEQHGRDGRVLTIKLIRSRSD